MSAAPRPADLEARTPDVHGVVLAGAYRWGASPFERLGPKPSLHVGLTPLVCHVVRWMAQGGVSRATVCANGASARDVRRCLAASALPGRGGTPPASPPELDLDHTEDRTPRGPAGCLKDAGRDSRADLFLVSEGTIVPEVDLESLLSLHVRRKAAVTVVVSPDGPGDRLSPVGVYVIDRRVLPMIPDVGYQDLKETLISRLHDQGELVVTFPAKSACPRVTCARSYIEANAWMLARLLSQPPERFWRRAGALVHETAHVDPSALLVGPALIGRGSRVRADAVVVGPAIVGDDTTIEDGAVVSRSVLRGSSTIGRGASIDQCAVGAGVAVAPGARHFDAVILGADPRPAPAPPRPHAERHASVEVRG